MLGNWKTVVNVDNILSSFPIHLIDIFWLLLLPVSLSLSRARVLSYSAITGAGHNVVFVVDDDDVVVVVSIFYVQNQFNVYIYSSLNV